MPSELFNCVGGCGRFVRVTPTQAARHHDAGSLPCCDDCAIRLASKAEAVSPATPPAVKATQSKPRSRARGK